MNLSVFLIKRNKTDHCNGQYTSYVVGKVGYVLGFCNEKELIEIQKYIPLDENHEFISFIVSKDFLERDLESAFNKLKEVYLNNTLNHRFVVTKDDVGVSQIEDLMCRIPSFVREPSNRPNVGDHYYYDNREKYYEMWDYKDVLFKIIGRTFNEQEQSFMFKIQMENGDIVEDVHESKLVNEKGRDEIIERIEKTKNDILDYHELKNKIRNEKEDRVFKFRKIHMSLHYEKLINQMIENGELPESFKVEDD